MQRKAYQCLALFLGFILPFAALAQNDPLQDAFARAKEAMQRDDEAGLAKVVAQANALGAEKHALAMYLPYWQLRTKLREGSIESTVNADVDVRDYLGKYANTVAADLIRRDWLLNLGKRREWGAFEAQLPLWALRDDTQVFCYEIEMKALKASQAMDAEQRASLLAAARPILNSAREFNHACSSMLETLAAQGVVSGQDIAARVYTAIEQNTLGHARRLAALVPAFGDAASFEQALSRPALVASTGKSPELRLAALARLARSSPEQAADILSQGNERSMAWAWVAAHAARKHLPQAGAWAAKSLNMSANAIALVNADTHHWMVRGALRDTDVKLAGQLIDRMNDAARHVQTASGARYLDDTWVYWRARAFAAQNDAENANKLYQSIAKRFSFYGQLASEELGAMQVVPEKAASLTPEDAAHWNNTASFIRAQKFYELGMRFEGNREWNWQLRGLSDRQLRSVAEWARQQQLIDRMINSSDRTSAEFDFSQRFPSPFKDLVVSSSKERALDAASVYGLVRQESRFLMDARSSVGAQGLMQIMPGTGRWIATKLGVKDFKTPMLSDPALNVSFGTFYLKTVLDEFDGSLALAAAAYNAGPGRSRTWRASLKQPVETAMWAETIPFSETRDYVKKVLSNAVIYGQVLGAQNATPATLKTRLGAITPKIVTSVSDTP